MWNKLTLWCLIYHVYHVGFLHPLKIHHYFLLSHWIIQKINYLSSSSELFTFAWCSLLLELSTVFWIFFTEFFSSKISVLFFLWYLFVFESFSFHELFSWFFCTAYLCSLPSHWVSLRSLFWIPFQAFHIFSFLWGMLLENYCVPWSCHVSFLFCFFCSYINLVHLHGSSVSSWLIKFCGVAFVGKDFFL